MAKQKQQQSGATALAEPPAEVGNYRINIRCRWCIPTILVEGASSEEEAREMLHRMLDESIIQVERAR